MPASLYPPAATSDLPRYLEPTARVLRSCGARAVITSPALLPHIDDAARGAVPTCRVVVAVRRARRRLRSTDAGAPRPTTSRSCSSRRDRRRRRRASSSRIAISRRTSPPSAAPRASATRRRTSPSAGCRCITTWASSAWRSARCLRRVPCVLLTPQAFVKRPVEWLRAISRHRGTISFAPNFAYDLAVRRVKDTDLADLDLSSWRVAGCGAEPIHAPTLAAFADKFGRSASARPAFCRATASPSTCSPRRCRRAGGGCASNASRPTTSTGRRVATARDGADARAGRGRQLRPAAAGLTSADRRRGRACPARAAHRRDHSGRALGHARLLQG